MSECFVLKVQWTSIWTSEKKSCFGFFVAYVWFVTLITLALLLPSRHLSITSFLPTSVRYTNETTGECLVGSFKQTYGQVLQLSYLIPPFSLKKPHWSTSPVLHGNKDYFFRGEK